MAMVEDQATALSTAPPPLAPHKLRGRGPRAAALRWWRQLTSMRTALMLLFLLAVASVPGSLLPQRSLNPERVAEYYRAHPQLAPLLDRAFMFDVFASPWFAAIYLLLFVSLVGCLTPRIRRHVRAMLRTPPDAPRHLDKLPYSEPAHAVDTAEPDAVAKRISELLRGRRWRTVVREHDAGVVTVSAEKGYLREVGNLLFHFSLVGLLVGVALGSSFGWHGNRLLVEGPDGAFCNTLQQYDEYNLGTRVSPADLPPFCLELRRFTANYLDNGQPVEFAADVRYEVAGAERPYRMRVNAPLRLSGANVHLIGHGYAPVIRYTDRYGRSQTSVMPFLPTDQNLTSEGVATFPDANLDPKTSRRAPDLQVAFEGLYLPTVPDSPPFIRSAFPAERAPGLLLFAYRGNIGLDAGIPRSVYTLDKRQIDTGRLKLIGSTPKMLDPGESWKLDDGTSVTFVGTRQWVSVQVRHDPGEPIVLAGAILLLIGLLGSLSVRRRRIWFRVVPGGESKGSTVAAGGLTRSGYTGFAGEFQRIVTAARRRE